MPKISYPTLQERHGGRWVALSTGEGKVYAAKRKFPQLLAALKKKGVSTRRVIFTRVEKPQKTGVYH